MSILRYWKTIGWFFFIFIISAVPGQDVPEIPIWNFDKLVHGAVYFGLAVIFYIDLKKLSGDGFWERNAYSMVLICSIAYGGLIEVLQASLFINRSGSWLDFCANTLGVLVAGAMVKAVRRRVWTG